MHPPRGPRRSPLLLPDPGWLFVIAGLVMCAAGILVPTQDDLDALQGKLDRLRGQEVLLSRRLAAHANFLEALDEGDPELIRRLAGGQLNLVPDGVEPRLLATWSSASITDRLDRTVYGQAAAASRAGPSSVAARARLTGGVPAGTADDASGHATAGSAAGGRPRPAEGHRRPPA